MRKKTLSRILMLGLCPILAMPTRAMAQSPDETPKAERPVDAPRAAEDELAKSLDRIIQQASEQGFIELKEADAEPGKAREQQAGPNGALRITGGVLQAMDQPNPGKYPLDPNQDCTAAEILDLQDYQNVTSYASVEAAKAEISDYDTFKGREPLVKTYWSLGLGMEVLPLAQSFSDDKALLVQAASRVIAGRSRTQDLEVFQSLLGCRADLPIWYEMAKITQPVQETGTAIAFNPKILEDFPPRLRDVFARRLGMALAGNGDYVGALSMLKIVDPKFSFKRQISLSDDETVFLHGLILKGQNNALGQSVIEHFAKHEGIVQKQAMAQLVNSAQEDVKAAQTGNLHNGLDDLAQTHQGSPYSRQLALKSINLNLRSDNYIDAIDVMARDLGQKSQERSQALASIGDAIIAGMEKLEISPRVNALAAYFYKTGFFEPYERISRLQMKAAQTALALDMPELSLKIWQNLEGDKPSDEPKPLSNDRVYAQILKSYKDGDVAKLNTYADQVKNDPQSQSLLTQAFVDLGAKSQALNIIRTQPSSESNLLMQADIEWQSGDFAAAAQALKTVQARYPNKGLDDRLEFSELLTYAPTRYGLIDIPENVDDLDDWRDLINTDLNIVRGYLSDG